MRPYHLYEHLSWEPVVGLIGLALVAGAIGAILIRARIGGSRRNRG